MNTSYVVLDLETTGLDYQTEQITEIGAIKIDENFNEIDRFHTMVSLEEGRELPEFITKLTGITTEDLVGWPPEKICLMELAEFIGDSIVVAQNAPFDLSFISRGGIEPKLFVCTRALVRYVEPELSASLKDVTARNGISLEGHHRALNDVEATIEVFKRYVEHVSYYSVINRVLDEPSRPLRFVPKGAKVRKVAYVAFEEKELAEITEGLPRQSVIHRRIMDVRRRMAKE
jgi:DNA polymerase III subunit epsilon